MIDPKMFDMARLLTALFDDDNGGDVWRRQAEIVPGYMPPYPRDNTRPRVVVRFGESFLRHSCGPRGGHFWDAYGDDYQTVELALVALLSAPTPPSACEPGVWKTWHAWRQAIRRRASAGRRGRRRAWVI